MVQSITTIDKKVTLILKLNTKLKGYLIDYYEYSKPAPNKLLEKMFIERAAIAKNKIELLTNVLRNMGVLNY